VQTYNPGNLARGSFGNYSDQSAARFAPPVFASMKHRRFLPVYVLDL